MTVVKSTGFARGDRQVAGKKLASHLKYIQYRSRGEDEAREDRYLFSEEGDRVSRREALDDVMQHTSTSVNYHRIVLSPDKNTEPITDWREWTRTIMRDFEDKKGLKLHWYAAKHANTDDPHIHIVIAGSGEDLWTGRKKAVKLYTGDRSPNGHDDFAVLSQLGREHSGYEIARRDQEIARQEVHREPQEENQVQNAAKIIKDVNERDLARTRKEKGIDR